MFDILKFNVLKPLFVLAVLTLILSVNSLSAEAAFEGEPDHIIINSADWRDVYSGMVYSNLIGKPASFLVSTRHSTIILFSFNPATTEKIEVSSSRANPFVVGYESIIEGRGFQAREERFENMNFELAQRLEGVRNFIIVDDSYGYDAISVASYAAIKRSYVLFAKRTNIARVETLLEQKGVDELIIYGNVQREVLNALQRFNPIIINEGDRYDNNLKIVERYLELRPDKRQVILNNGEFIERQLFLGDDPVVFIGTLNVPDQVRNFIRNNRIEVGVLIGNELIGTASTIRRQLGINVFVKFAQSARIPGGTIAQVEDLDRFPMPRYVLNLEITAARYNELTNTLQIVYRNPVEQSLYLRSTITVRGPAGEIIAVRGDETPIFVEGQTYRTVLYYDIENVPDNSVAAIFTLFGESRRSLELSLSGELPINKVSVRDDSEIELVSLVYDRGRNAFVVQVRNAGRTDTYVQLEAIDVLINGVPTTLGSTTHFIRAGRTAAIRIPTGDFSPEDVENNPRIRVIGYYGEREDSLVKSIERTFDMVERGIPYALYITAIIIILLLIYALKAKKCRHCEERNMIISSHCKRCGREL